MLKTDTPTNILSIDGVEYNVPTSLNIGDSIFIPCLKPNRVLRAVSNHYKVNKNNFAYREGIELKMLGIRIWRAV